MSRKSRSSHILESSYDSGNRKKSFNISSRYKRKPLEDSISTSISLQSLYDPKEDEQGEDAIIFNSPPVECFPSPSSQQKQHPPTIQPDITNNCFLLSLRWLYQYLVGSLNCFIFRPIIRIFYKEKNNSPSTYRSATNQKERSSPISLALTHNSKQQLDISDINRAQMYPFSSRGHDFDLYDRRLSCESTTSPSLVSFNFFPSSPLHSVEANQFIFELKDKKINSSHTISHSFAKKRFMNTQPLNCSHLTVRETYTLNRHRNNPFRMNDENNLTNNLPKQKWISEQTMFTRDYQALKEEKRKRTILIERQHGSYGFTLQVCLLVSFIMKYSL